MAAMSTAARARRLSSLYQVTKRANSNPSLSPRASLDSSRTPGRSVESTKSAKSAKSSMRAPPDASPARGKPEAGAGEAPAAPVAAAAAASTVAASPFGGYTPFDNGEAQLQHPAVRLARPGTGRPTLHAQLQGGCTVHCRAAKAP